MRHVPPVQLVRMAGCRCAATEVVARGPWWACARCSVAVRKPGTERHGDEACHYCGRREADGVVLTRDHIVPRSAVRAGGGAGRAEGKRNIVMACRGCNARKGAMRASCACRKCRWAWKKWGPEGWEKWEVWSPKVVYVQRA